MRKSASVLLIWLFALQAAPQLQGPTVTPKQAFEAASIKVSKAGTRAPMQWTPGGRFSMGLPIQSLLSIGYEVPLLRVENVPDWVRTTFFDITATAGRDVTVAERPAYYRGLLEDRFKLTYHVEPRELPAYALVLARSDGRLGPGLRRSTTDCEPILGDRRRRAEAGERLPGAPAPGEAPVCASVGGVGGLTARAMPLAALASMLSGALQRPVVDHTGLDGGFDIDFRAAPPRANPAQVPDDLPSVFTAVQEQLGLKLEDTKAPMSVLVIDHIEMPTAD